MHATEFKDKLAFDAQCGAVDLSVLTAALKEHGQGQVIDLLYVHNSTVNELRDNTFQHISVNNIQLSRCEIRRIGPAAFRGQEETLRNLNLQVLHLVCLVYLVSLRRCHTAYWPPKNPILPIIFLVKTFDSERPLSNYLNTVSFETFSTKYLLDFNRFNGPLHLFSTEFAESCLKEVFLQL